MIPSCPICRDDSARIERSPEGQDAYDVVCPKCGSYRITQTAAHSDLERFGSRFLLSAIVRNRMEQEGKLVLGTQSFEHLIESRTLPTDPFDKLDLLLEHVLRIAGRVDKPVKFNIDTDFPLLFAQDKDEFWFYLNKALDLGLLERAPSGYRLTLNGWKQLSIRRKPGKHSDSAFVAMWFSKELDPVWSDGFQPALAKCGFKPIRIDLEEHNEKICDRILSEIRSSALVVADFTGQRGGVYFESGFAMGLGIPVIRTCRSDQVEALHFDTRQYNHVLWEAPADLAAKLVNRIRATIPSANPAP